MEEILKEFTDAKGRPMRIVERDESGTVEVFGAEGWAVIIEVSKLSDLWAALLALVV